VHAQGGPRTPEEFFDDRPDGLALYRLVERAVTEIGEAAVRVTRSQIAFRRRRGFAYVWRPDRYVRSSVPAVLAIALPHELASVRVKAVAHPTQRLWMHHVELSDPAQVDEEIRGWLAEAYDDAG
jgi:Domain of unknown function (DUF5655)